MPVSISTDGDKTILNVGIDGLSEGEKEEFFAEAVKKSDTTAYEGHIEHAYSRRHAYQTEKCPASTIIPLNDNYFFLSVITSFP